MRTLRYEPDDVAPLCWVCLIQKEWSECDQAWVCPVGEVEYVEAVEAWEVTD